MRMRFVVVVALVVASLVGTLHASDNSKVTLSEIRTFVDGINNEKLKAFVADEIVVVESVVAVKKTRSTDKQVLDQISSQFAALPEFADRKIEFRTYRVKSESFAPEAVSLGDVIYVNEAFLGKILFTPGGRDVLTAMLAHEMSHHRDFLVKRAINNDRFLSPSEKQNMLLQVEMDADRGAALLLSGVGLRTDALKTMLLGFGEVERLRQIESSKVVASVGND